MDHLKKKNDKQKFNCFLEIIKSHGYVELWNELNNWLNPYEMQDSGTSDISEDESEDNETELNLCRKIFDTVEKYTNFKIEVGQTEKSVNRMLKILYQQLPKALDRMQRDTQENIESYKECVKELNQTIQELQKEKGDDKYIILQKQTEIIERDKRIKKLEKREQTINNQAISTLQKELDTRLEEIQDIERRHRQETKHLRNDVKIIKGTVAEQNAKIDKLQDTVTNMVEVFKEEFKEMKEEVKHTCMREEKWSSSEAMHREQEPRHMLPREQEPKENNYIRSEIKDIYPPGKPRMQNFNFPYPKR